MELRTVSGQFFNTENSITAYCDLETLNHTLSLCERYHALLSKTLPDSDVWRLNHAQGAVVNVSEHTAQILRLALEMYQASGGSFNIAVGPAIKLWHFNDEKFHVPDREALKAALSNTDCRKISINENQVCLPDGMQIDLGGIAKGYIADRIAEYLRSKGIRSALINLGGNIATVGRKPDGNPWCIGLQLPTRDRTQRQRFWAVVECSDASVVTSGSYERGFFSNDRWYHHILNPQTGMPIDNGVLSVTVCARESFLADALTTPLFILGPEKGAELAQQYQVDVAYYMEGDCLVMNSGMQKRILEGPSMVSR